MPSPHPRAERLTVVFTGLAVPCMVFGKIGIIFPVVPAIIAACYALGWRGVRTAIVDAIRTPIGIAVCLTAVAWLAGVLHSLNSERSFEAWFRTFLFVAIAVVLWRVVVSDRNLSSLALKAAIFGTAVAIGLANLGIYVPEVLGLIHAHGWRPEKVVAGLKQFASPAMLLVPIALWAIWRLDGWWRLVSAVSILGIFNVLVATSSRSSFAGLFAMLVVASGAIVWRRRSRRLLVGAVAAILLAAVAVFAWLQTVPLPPWQWASHETFPVWLIDAPRQEIWTFTWKKIMESPWLGYGINCINFLPGANKYVPGMGLTTYISGHPHNWALEIFGETGVFGITTVVFAAGLALWRLVSGFRATGNPAYLAAASVHMGYWVAGLFTVSFWSAWWQVSYLMLLALAYPVGAVAGRDRSSAP